MQCPPSKAGLYTRPNLQHQKNIKLANVAKEILELEAGDNVVMTGGLINGKAGNTNTIKVETVI